MTIEKPLDIEANVWEKTPQDVQVLIQEMTERVEKLESTNQSLQKALETKDPSHYQEERRQVTVIFADLSGFTALNDAAKSPADVERVIGLVNSLLQELSEAIFEFDGHIDKYIGDEIMALFGAPKAHENDPELALRAALSMMERLKAFNDNPPLPLAEKLGMHMGINTGTVIAGMVGSKRQRSYTVMGDAVNVAARLEGVSVRGQIFVSETTYNLTKRLFEFEERDSVMVKGKAKPLKVYELKSARERPLPDSGGQAPFTGREDELTTLHGLHEKLMANQGSIVIISSDAGMGKSRLIQEFRNSVDALRETPTPLWLQSQAQMEQSGDGIKPLWLFGRGLSYRRSFANRLFVDILYSYLGVSTNSDSSQVKARLEAMVDDLFKGRQDEILPYLATMLGLTLDSMMTEKLPLNDPQVLQQRTFAAVRDWVEALAKRHPVIIVFEDLHWADDSSVILIEHLFTVTFDTPVMLICATRLERQTDFWAVKNSNVTQYGEDIKEIILWPLTDHESRQLITNMLHIDHLPQNLENVLLRRAEGNPLFLEEVLRGLIEQEVVQYKDGQWKISRDVTDLDVPDTLQGVFRARIDRLEENVKRVLQIAAVIGRVFPQFVLKPMVENPDILDKAIEALQVADLIKISTDGDEPEYMFKHMITYEIAYNTLLLSQRQEMHKRIADHMSRLYFLIGEQYAPQVADHYSKSEIWDRAFKYTRRAAEAAIQSFFNREAVEFYTKALDIVPKIPAEKFDESELVQIYQGRANILARLGESQRAIADYEAMLDKAKAFKDDYSELRALNGIGTLHANSDFSSAAELFQEALQVARRIGDQKGIADTLNRLGQFYYNMGDLDKATLYYQEAHELSIQISQDTARIEAEDGLAAVNLEQGNTSLVVQQYENEIIPTRRRLAYRGGLLKSLSNLLRVRIFTGNYEQADSIIAETDQLYQQAGEFYLAPLVRYHQALGHIYRGQFKLAEENLHTGLEIAQKQQQKGWQVLGTTWLCYYHLILGLNERCFDEAEKNCKLALSLGSPLYILRAQWILSAAQRRLQKVDEAITSLENTATVSTKMNLTLDSILILYQLARAYIENNQWDKGESVVKELFALAQHGRIKEYIIRAELLQASIDSHYGRPQAALNTLMQAAKLADQTGSLLAQYLVEIQKAALQRELKNDIGAQETIATAKNIEQTLIEPLDSEFAQAFLNSQHASQLRQLS